MSIIIDGDLSQNSVASRLINVVTDAQIPVLCRKVYGPGGMIGEKVGTILSGRLHARDRFFISCANGYCPVLLIIEG